MVESLDSLWAVSAVDGRYRKDLESLRPIVSEGALNRFRMMVEAAWALELSEIPEIASIMKLPDDTKTFLCDLEAGEITESMIAQVKETEAKTNHDVKAVEYVLRHLLIARGAPESVLPWIHFACTSEDINNLSYALMLKEARSKVLLPLIDEVIAGIKTLAINHRAVPMLARTHGQTASPTTVGKEMAVFVRRLMRQREKLLKQPVEGKINGAVGNFNAHIAAFPEVSWIAISEKFVTKRLQLNWNPLTTQIETHDTFVEMMEILRMFNTILLDFCRDMWGYISHGYFAQKTVAGEVGSSTMPHKVNPIYFENAEGNLGVANSLLSHFGEKLPISRFQRDLSDSTVLRVTGTALAHAVLAWKSVLKGLARVEVNGIIVAQDLDGAWEVLGEAVQTVMRRYGVGDAYERLKAATRGQPIVTRDMIHAAIDGCGEIPQTVKLQLKELTPGEYIGLASQLVDWLDHPLT